jgi:hypothetical protein
MIGGIGRAGFVTSHRDRSQGAGEECAPLYHVSFPVISNLTQQELNTPVVNPLHVRFVIAKAAAARAD